MLNHEMACRVCRFQLNIVSVGGKVSYEHPIDRQSDHTLVVVPARRLWAVRGLCHLCNFHLPVWTVRTSAFDAGAAIGFPHQFPEPSTAWNVCDICYSFIVNRDNEGFIAHVISDLGRHPDEPRTLGMITAQIGVALHQLPGRTLVTTCRWNPTPLKAATLPKVRDRLSALMRSDDELPLRLGDRQLRSVLADGLDQARLYWIDPQVTDLINAVATELPDTTITERIVPSGSGLLVWPKPIDRRYELQAAGWTRHGSGWEMTCYRSIGADLPEARLQGVRQDVGWLVPVHSIHVPSGATVNGDDPLAALVTSWLLIHQELAETEPTPVDPALRRKYQRAKRKPADVRLVRLKPQTSRPPGPSTPSDSSKPQRKTPDYRYWVSEHTRQQAYGPQRSLRRETPIEPYLKGPNDRPIKASTTVRILRPRPQNPTDD